MSSKRQKKLPAIQFYPGDWKKDPGIQALDFFHKGVWFEMILMMHESEERGVLMLNGKPYPNEALARALGLDNQILTTTLTTLTTYGVAKVRKEDGAIYSRKMVRDEEIRQIRIKAGSKGGNPNLLNQKATTTVNQKTTTRVNQKSTPSSSSSSSISLNINKKKNPPTPKGEPLNFPPKLDNEACKTAWRDWLEHKKALGKGYKSIKSQEILLRQWADRPTEFIKSIIHSIGQNYQGIFPPPNSNQIKAPYQPPPTRVQPNEWKEPPLEKEASYEAKRAFKEQVAALVASKKMI